jgi:hypothetical protein
LSRKSNRSFDSKIQNQKSKIFNRKPAVRLRPCSPANVAIRGRLSNP